MDILSGQFVSALAAIVVIDLMLAGDNAIVIALAARNVPQHLQKRAIAWGTLGAIVVRSLMTLVVVWLLQIPGLLLAGGVLLIWIAYKLLLPDDSAEPRHDAAERPSGFWRAMRTIVVADAVMGLDNVLAVAGAAHGNYVLVVLGLLISIPIVVWGSGMLLKWVERFPAIVYFGAGVLAWTAVKMILSEPFVKTALEGHGWYLDALAYLAAVGGVLYAGLLHNHRHLESRIHARIAQLKAANAQAADPSRPEEGIAMKTLLVPVGSSRNMRFAIDRVILEARRSPDVEVHLLNVQRPFSRHVSQFLARDAREEFHRERAEETLAPARTLLDRQGVRYTVHIRTGDRASIIAQEAKRLQCDHIVMTTSRKNSITRMLESSTTHRVLELSSIPVELVAGDEVSKLERFGVPAGVATAIALLVAAVAD